MKIFKCWNQNHYEGYYKYKNYYNLYSNLVRVISNYTYNACQNYQAPQNHSHIVDKFRKELNCQEIHYTKGQRHIETKFNSINRVIKLISILKIWVNKQLISEFLILGIAKVSTSRLFLIILIIYYLKSSLIRKLASSFFSRNTI